jgi:hypothetical protein
MRNLNPYRPGCVPGNSGPIGFASSESSDGSVAGAVVGNTTASPVTDNNSISKINAEFPGLRPGIPITP